MNAAGSGTLDDLEAGDGVEELAGATSSSTAGGAVGGGAPAPSARARRRWSRAPGRCPSPRRPCARAARTRARRRSRCRAVRGRRAGACRRRPAEVTGNLVADERQPRRPEPMQRAELAVRVPPLRREGREAGDLGRIDGLARPGPLGVISCSSWLVMGAPSTSARRGVNGRGVPVAAAARCRYVCASAAASSGFAIRDFGAERELPGATRLSRNSSILRE